MPAQRHRVIKLVARRLGGSATPTLVNSAMTAGWLIPLAMHLLRTPHLGVATSLATSVRWWRWSAQCHQM